MEKLEVQFRIFQGEVIAVFPYMIWNDDYVTSYAHVGQHSGCVYWINENSKPATEKEYLPLLQELRQIYDDCELVVIQRRNHGKYLDAWNEFHKHH